MKATHAIKGCRCERTVELADLGLDELCKLLAARELVATQLLARLRDLDPALVLFLLQAPKDLRGLDHLGQHVCNLLLLPEETVQVAVGHLFRAVSGGQQTLQLVFQLCIAILVLLESVGSIVGPFGLPELNKQEDTKQ